MCAAVPECVRIPCGKKDIELIFNDETGFREPRGWIGLSDGRYYEICHEEDGLAPDDQYYTVRLHCSEEDFENDKYHGTCGVIAISLFDAICEVRDYLSKELSALANAGISVIS